MFSVQCVTGNNAYIVQKEDIKILGRELKRTCLRQKACSILCFCWYYFLGPYLHWQFVRWLFCWVVLFQGQCRPQVHNNLKRPRLYNLNHCLTSDVKRTLYVELLLLMRGVSTSRKHAESKTLKESLNNVYNLWIFIILVLCDKSPCPIPPNQTISRECLRPRICSISMSTSSIAARCYITVRGRRKRDRTGWEWFK